MNDDELIRRMRSALDEVHDAAPADATGEPVIVAAVNTTRTSFRGWLAVAAAAAVLGAGLGVVLVQRHGDQRAIGPASSGSEPATSASTTAPANGTEWYVLDLDGFASQPERLEVCCPPTPAPGPSTVMVWVDVNGLDRGVLMLTLTPVVEATVPGATEPQLDWSWAMMPDDRASTLISEVVPGSGVPYVLPSQSMGLAGLGLQGMGAMRSQRWSNTVDSVGISVGDYRGQLGHSDSRSWEATTVAGHPALRRRDDTGAVAVVWQTPSGQWATVDISASLADREAEILGRVRVADGEPTTPSTGTPPATATSTTDSGLPEQAGTVLVGAASIIDSGKGPMLANVLLASLPPQGGEVPIDGFDWSMVDDEQTVSGVTWTETWYEFTGTWDGTTFHLEQPPRRHAPTTGGPAPDFTLTPGCTDAALLPLLDQMQAVLEPRALLISEWAGVQTGGRCGAHVTAWFESAALDAALAQFGDRVTVTYLFTPTQA
jgi:hypothetical protein